MALQNKIKYNLSKLLSRLVWDPNAAMAFCDAAINDSDPANPIRFNSTQIRFANVSAMEMWSNIIAAASEQDLLLELLAAVRAQYSSNADLSFFYNEISSGFERRVGKIAQAIKNNDCILFLGPELLQCIVDNHRTEAFSRQFAIELSKRLENAGVYFDKDLDYSLSYMANRYEDMPNVVSRELGNEALKSFSRARVYKTVFEKIAQLKFPLVINTNPDNLLELEYKERNIPYSVGVYDRSNQNKNAEGLDENTSIIYKIFGSFDNPYSILITDNDRVQFSKNVVKNDPPVPPMIKVLLENKCCLFLGFNFQEWHLKILIDCLGLAKKEDQTFALLMGTANESSVEHFEKNYKFYFINEEIEKFLDDLIRVIPTIPEQP